VPMWLVIIGHNRLPRNPKATAGTQHSAPAICPASPKHGTYTGRAT
jgi:hypothetical protein